MRPTVLIYEPDTPAAAAAYASGIARELPEVEVAATSNLEEAVALAADAAVLIAKAQDVLPALVAAMPRLEWIQALTTGVDPLRVLGLPPSILVTTVRGIHGPQMAELALLGMMALSRDFPRLIANQRAARWERWGQRLLLGKTAVVVGVGAISEAIAAYARPFGLRLIGVSARSGVGGFDEIYPRARLLEAAARADFLVIVAPYTAETHHLVDARVLAAMPASAFLVNIARGKLVDEEALVAALRARRIAGAALDVFETEPLPAASPLWRMPNVIVTPHIGGMSDVYAEQALPVVLHNLRAFLARDGAAMLNRVDPMP